MKQVRYLIEACIVTFFFTMFRIIGLKPSSAVGSFLARHIGPFLKAHRTAQHNIASAMPNFSQTEQAKILNDMWDNLGRTFCELPHLRSITGEKFTDVITLHNKEVVDNAATAGKGILIISGHFANWELGPRALAEIGHPMICAYRKANNPYVDKIIQKQRSTSNKKMVKKGKEAAKAILKELRKKGSVGMLVDQKMNNGIAAPFFERDAMTAPAIAEFSKKFDCPIIPFQITRDKECTFTGSFLPPLDTEGKSTLQIITDINAMYEDWIRQNPAQWFWVHNRWPKE